MKSTLSTPLDSRLNHVITCNRFRRMRGITLSASEVLSREAHSLTTSRRSNHQELNMLERIVAKQAVGSVQGGNQDSWINPPFNAQITFPGTFSTAPIVVVTALQDPNDASSYPDTFSVTVTKVTTTGFNVNITREDRVFPNYSGSDWGQNLYVSYIAEVPSQ
ncbi:H-type lectin domain-containing protein [Burkholderia cepacia]|uniref:H-type lectin domain-containing protein n=1 Tax=Burkholderia cepacia TaxID=292 RepID=UPI0012D979B3|nr:H-type lectin domain-containing protein [Burkholderia cepacia]